MLYQVPSGSKSSGSVVLVGFACWKAERFAVISQVPSGLTRTTPLGTRCPLARGGIPCEQPAPASRPYGVPPRKATAPTPLTRPPLCGLVWLEGKPWATGLGAEGPGLVGSTLTMSAPVALPE